jgi:hypothetical protein
MSVTIIPNKRITRDGTIHWIPYRVHSPSVAWGDGDSGWYGTGAATAHRLHGPAIVSPRGNCQWHVGIHYWSGLWSVWLFRAVHPPGDQ